MHLKPFETNFEVLTKNFDVSGMHLNMDAASVASFVYPGWHLISHRSVDTRPSQSVRSYMTGS
jgi:hypothetical protein